MYHQQVRGRLGERLVFLWSWNGNLGIDNLCGQTVANLLCQVELVCPSEGDFKLHTNLKSLAKKEESEEKDIA